MPWYVLTLQSPNQKVRFNQWDSSESDPFIAIDVIFSLNVDIDIIIFLIADNI